MRVLVTGAGGFIGRRLVTRLVEQGKLADADGTPRAITELLLVDRDAAVLEKLVRETDASIKLTSRAGDLRDTNFVEGLFADDVDSVFHLAATLTLDAERDFDTGWSVNMLLPFRMLEACRRQGARPRFVYASSIAVFGGRLPERVDDWQAQRPQTSYGTAKSITELLINDYSRHGLVDGRSLRLPVVMIRPGQAGGGMHSGAVSDLIGALAREPLAGRAITSPLGWDTRFPVVSAGRVAENLLRLHDVPAECFSEGRAVNQPGLTVSVADIAAALGRVAGSEAAKLLSVAPDSALERVVASWPREFVSEVELDPPLLPDPDFDSILRDHVRA